MVGSTPAGIAFSAVPLPARHSRRPRLASTRINRTRRPPQSPAGASPDACFGDHLPLALFATAATAETGVRYTVGACQISIATAEPGCPTNRAFLDHDFFNTIDQPETRAVLLSELRLNRDQGLLFDCFNLEEAVPGDHQVRQPESFSIGSRRWFQNHFRGSRVRSQSISLGFSVKLSFAQSTTLPPASTAATPA
jgi:hypothetical protein